MTGTQLERPTRCERHILGIIPSTPNYLTIRRANEVMKRRPASSSIPQRFFRIPEVSTAYVGTHAA